MPSKAKANTPVTSWRNVLPIHPAAELFPLMSPDELKVLGADIKKNGLTSPIVLWSPGDQTEKDQPVYLLDGRSRLDAMEAEGFKPATPRGLSPDFILPCNTSSSLQLHGWTHHLHEKSKSAFNIVIGGGANTGKPTITAATDPYQYVLSANIHRRHLTPEQKRDLIAKLIKQQPNKSNRQIAATVKASHPTVAKVRDKLEKKGDVEKVTTSIDSKGRKQPAKKERRTEDDFRRDVQAKAIAKLDDIGSTVPVVNTTTATAVPAAPSPDNTTDERRIIAMIDDGSICQLIAKWGEGKDEKVRGKKAYRLVRSLIGPTRNDLSKFIQESKFSGAFADEQWAAYDEDHPGEKISIEFGPATLRRPTS